MIPATYFWTIILTLMIGTICIRGSIIAVSSRLKITPQLKQLFTYFPAAIFPAFIVPVAFFHQGQAQALQGKERLVVLFLAGLVSYWTRSTVATITIGLVTLYLIVQSF